MRLSNFYTFHLNSVLSVNKTTGGRRSNQQIILFVAGTHAYLRLDELHKMMMEIYRENSWNEKPRRKKIKKGFLMKFISVEAGFFIQNISDFVIYQQTEVPTPNYTQIQSCGITRHFMHQLATVFTNASTCEFYSSLHVNALVLCRKELIRTFMKGNLIIFG